MTDTSTVQHTSGPLTYELAVYSDDAEWSVSTPLRRVALVNNGADNAEANARLFAAAPDLLEALETLLNVEGAATFGAELPSFKGLDVAYHFNKARAAIAKAVHRKRGKVRSR